MAAVLAKIFPLKKNSRVNIRFNEFVLCVDDAEHVLDFPIIDAAPTGPRLRCVRLHGLSRESPAKNLSAYDKDGEQLWTVFWKPD